MSRIPVPAIEQVPAESQALLARVKSRLGTVPNMYRIIANSPAALGAFLGFYSALDKGGGGPAHPRAHRARRRRGERQRLLPVGADASRPQGRDAR